MIKKFIHKVLNWIATKIAGVRCKCGKKHSCSE